MTTHHNESDDHTLLHCWYAKVRCKVHAQHEVNEAALISISLALSQTPVYTAGPWIQG